jgi:ribonuclease HI
LAVPPQTISPHIHISPPQDEVTVIHLENKDICTVKIGTYNIEGIRTPGRLQEACAFALAQNLELLVLTECKTGEFSIMELYGFTIMQSGEVIFILSQKWSRSWTNFLPHSDRLVQIDIRIRGGYATFLGIYFPYERHTPENETIRQNAMQQLDTALTKINHPGPVMIIGDFNTSFSFRREEEKDVLGPFFYNPHIPNPTAYTPNRDLFVSHLASYDLAVAATFFDKPQHRRITFYAKGSMPTHRAVCEEAEPELGFLPGFAAAAPILDTTKYREIDHIVISRKYLRSITNIIPLQKVCMGYSTHHPVVACLNIPPVCRPKRTGPVAIPRMAWTDPACVQIIKETILAYLKERGDQEFLNGFQPTDLTNLRDVTSFADGLQRLGIPPVNGALEEIGIEISMDGGYHPQTPDHPERASFSFVVLAGIPDTDFIPWNGKPDEKIPDEDQPWWGHKRTLPRPILFKRFGSVILDPTNKNYLGATSLSSHSAELTAFAEALLFVLVEAPDSIKSRPILFTFDSKNAGNQVAGDWLIRRPIRLADFALGELLSTPKLSSNWQIADFANQLWTLLRPDETFTYGNWIKGHYHDFANNIADDGATQGLTGVFSLPMRDYDIKTALRHLGTADRKRAQIRAMYTTAHRVAPAFQIPIFSLYPTTPAHEEKVSLPSFSKGNFLTLKLPLLSPSSTPTPTSADHSASQIYNKCLDIHEMAAVAIRTKLPKKTPRFGWQSLDLQRIAEKRDVAFSEGNFQLADFFTQELKRQSRREKRAFLLRLTEKEGGIDWRGPNAMKQFRKTPIRIIDPRTSQIVPADQRAEVIAQHYMASQWADAPTPPLPSRPPLFPPLDVSVTPFTPPELRVAAKSITPKKAAGHDKLQNEFIRILLSIPVMFTAILCMFNDVWINKVAPGGWWVARIVAIYKKKNLPIEDPGSYRPIALLQSFYKLFTKLLELRLSPALRPRICAQQYGFLPLLSISHAIFYALRAIEMAETYQHLPLYILLLDWEKCYDRIRTEPMLHALGRLGIPTPYLLVLRHIYRNMTFYVGDKFGDSGIYSQETGLRQGDPLSCLLCIALLTVIMLDAEARWKEALLAQNLTQHETDMCNTLLKTAGKELFIYADDSNLLAASLKKIRCMFHSIQTEGEFYGFKVKTTSAFLLRAGAARNLPPPALKDIHGASIPEKPTASTLGFYLSAASMSHKIVQERGSAMLRAMKLYKVLWTAHLPLKRIVQKYFALVVSKATHGLQVVALSDDQLSHLEHVHHRCVRRILGIKAAYVNRISNAEVRKRAGVKTILYYIRIEQYKFLGHILRLPLTHPDRLIIFKPDNTLTPQIPALPYAGSSNQNKKVGRPRVTWIGTLLPPLLRTHTVREILELATDTSRWFTATSRLCSDAG